MFSLVKAICLLLVTTCWISVVSSEDKKVVICGVCKNAEKQLPNTFESINALAKRLSDYRVVIYENNSTDRTKELLREWAAKDPKVFIISEDFSKRQLKRMTRGKRKARTEYVARARNRVLDEVMQQKYDAFPFLIMADLDMDPWDVEGILDTLNTTDIEWDAVCANGSYDRYAFRNEEYPFGFELVGKELWKKALGVDLHLSETGEWKLVYSAFGGLGIYKRDAIRGCRYSGVVTNELETLMQGWIREGIKRSVFLAKDYQELLKSAPIVDVYGSMLSDRAKYPSCIGMRLHQHGAKVVWFGVGLDKTLPTVCEHVPFHASMISKGRDKIYLNPRLQSTHP